MHLVLQTFLSRKKDDDFVHLLLQKVRLVLQKVRLLLYVIPRIVSATFLFREWVVHSSEEKEKVADAKYCATV